MRKRRAGDGRRRRRSSAESSARQGKGPGEEGNGSRTTRRCFPCEESSHDSRRRRIDGDGGALTATAMGDGEGARVWAKGRV